jgi:Mrp family chromosome partitioning ATPase/capsular polysaccharide biosynthesis protein
VDRLPEGWDEGPGLVASVWRFRWLVAAVALAGAVAGVGFSTVQPVMYEGSSQILLARQSGQTDGQSVEPDRYVRNQAAFIMSPPVLERAVQLVKGRVTVKQLRQRLVAEASKESDLVTVRVQDPTAQGAVELANAVGRAYEDTALKQARDAVNRTVRQLQETGRALSQRLAELEARLQASPDATTQVQRDAVKEQLAQVLKRAEELQLDDTQGNPVVVRERAELPDSPVQPKPLRLAAVGGLLGLLVAAGLAWWLAWRRQTPASSLQPPAPVETAPLLGEIPDFAELAEAGEVPTSTDPESAPGQAYRELAASLRAVLNQTGTRALAVTSPEPGDGKTLTSVNLAVAMGESGEHVVLVDADGRRRGLSQLCDLDGQPGLTDLGVDATPIDYCLWLPTFTSIQVIPAGAPVADTTGFLEGPAFSKAMYEVRQHAGLTLVDAPPLLSAPDALAIAAQVDGVVLVVRPETSATTLIEARQRLDGTGARLLGYVVNRNSAGRNRRAVVGGDGHEPAGAAKELEGSVRLAGHAHEANGAMHEPDEDAEELAGQTEAPAVRQNTKEAKHPAGQSREFAEPPVASLGPGD